MGYTANSAFTAGGVKYRPGDNVPEIENARKFLELGFIISGGDFEESEAPKIESGAGNSDECGENSSENAEDNGAENAGKTAENGGNKAKKAAKK